METMTDGEKRGDETDGTRRATAIARGAATTGSTYVWGQQRKPSVGRRELQQRIKKSKNFGGLLTKGADWKRREEKNPRRDIRPKACRRFMGKARAKTGLALRVRKGACTFSGRLRAI